MRFDLLGVREFAEKLTLTGGLGSSGASAPLSKARKGVKLHKAVQKYLETLHPDFASEKQVLYKYISEDPELLGDGEFTLEGRIDGLHKEGEITVISEIKSADIHPEAADITHLAQGEIYGFILTADQPEDTMVRIDVIYGLYSDFTALRIFSVDHTAKSLRERVVPLLFRYSTYVSYLNRHNRELEAELTGMPFMYGSFRQGQRTMAVNVYNALKNADIPVLQVNAPTGIGKTAAAIYPALKALDFKAGERSAIFYLTAKNEGARPAEETLKLALGSVPSMKVCSLSAKDKICIFKNENAAENRGCDPDNCPYAKNNFTNVRSAIREALSSGVSFFDRAYVQEISKKQNVCPFELMLDLTQFCDVIIGDYNYLFDPESYLKRWFAEERGNYYFLIDEAHQLPERVRSMYSASLDVDSLMNCAKKKKRLKLGKELIKAAELIDDYSRSEEEGIVSDASELIKVTDKLTDLAFEYLEKHEDENLLELCFNMLHFKTVYSMTEDGGFLFSSSHEDGGTSSLLCMDPSGIIRRKCAIGQGAVLFSGSLLPEPFFAELLGAKDMPFVSLSTPFPKENLLALAGTFADTRYRAREASKLQVASFIADLSISLKTGNFIVFFGSWTYMESVYGSLDENFRENYVFVQPKSSDQESRNRFVEGFESSPSKLHIGFCVLGGSYSEGLDLPGDRLSGVVIVGTGIPQVGRRTELLRSYYEKGKDQGKGQETDQETVRDMVNSGENIYLIRAGNDSGFKNAYFYPGVNKVIQAAGRVIRTDTDRGFVLFLDSRYSRRDYINALSGCYKYEVIRDAEKTIRRIVDFISEI